MRPFLITIERGVTRRAHSLKQLRAEGMDFEFVDGVDGLLVPPLPSNYGKGDKVIKNTELGCYYSHIRAFQRLLDHGWPHALILEDDFSIVVPGRLATVMDDLPERCDYLALHRYWLAENEVRERGEKFNRLRPIGVTTTGYVISAKLAEIMLREYAVASKPIDLALCDVSHREDLFCYELATPIINGHAAQTSLIHGPR